MYVECAYGIQLRHEQIVPERSAVYDGFNVRPVGIQANHMDMTKFSGPDDEGYKRVLQQVRRQIKESSVASDART